MTEISKKRILRDLNTVHESALPGIHILSDERNIYNLLFLIIGPEDTPYSGGFFLFELVFPPEYPFKPPTVEIRTTNARYRFNPNFYLEGKVCLSILGTWPGEPWEPIMDLRIILLSIQSRLNQCPLENEPGYERVSSREKQIYNHAVTELTISEAVIGQLTRPLPKPKLVPDLSFAYFLPIMRRFFRKHQELYVKAILDLPDGAESIRYGGYSYKCDKVKLLNNLEQLNSSIASADADADEDPDADTSTYT
jgi:ubiquitin-conjugating enzyme E2 Z